MWIYQENCDPLCAPAAPPRCMICGEPVARRGAACPSCQAHTIATHCRFCGRWEVIAHAGNSADEGAWLCPACGAETEAIALFRLRRCSRCGAGYTPALPPALLCSDCEDAEAYHEIHEMRTPV